MQMDLLTEKLVTLCQLSWCLALFRKCQLMQSTLNTGQSFGELVGCFSQFLFVQ